MSADETREAASYSVKDMLAIQGKALERIERKVEEGNKEQVAFNARIDTRVSLLEQRPDLEPRVRLLEDAQNSDDGEQAYRRFFWPTVWGVIVAAAGWLSGHHL